MINKLKVPYSTAMHFGSFRDIQVRKKTFRDSCRLSLTKGSMPTFVVRELQPRN